MCVQLRALFSELIHVETTEIAELVPTQGFLELLTFTQKGQLTHPPLTVPPFLLAQSLCPKNIASSDARRCLMISILIIRVKGFQITIKNSCIIMYQLRSIQAVCRPHYHQCLTTNHHTLCPIGCHNKSQLDPPLDVFHH